MIPIIKVPTCTYECCTVRNQSSNNYHLKYAQRMKRAERFLPLRLTEVNLRILLISVDRQERIAHTYGFAD